jgi:RNA polymerase sigma-70 factor (ECF subfamily)
VEVVVPGDALVDFDEFFADAYPSIVRSVFVVVGDWEVAREVGQEAFVKALRHWQRVSTYEHPVAWVRRVAIRIGVRTRQRESRSRAGNVAEVATVSSPSDDLEWAINQLPQMQRAAIALHYLDDLPIKEVAQTLGCATATAKVHLHRARQRLGTILNEEFGDAAR